MNDPKELTDTGKQRAVEEAAERGARRAIEENTPPIGHRHGDSGEMYEVSERVVKRMQPEHMLFCENDPAGPACKVTRRLAEMERRAELRFERIQNEQMDDRKEVLRVQQALDKFIGERDFKRWLLPMVASLLGSSLATALIMFVISRVVLRLHP